jgi:hypothetical protein
MDTPPVFGLRELLTHVVGDIAKAVAVREGEPPARQAAHAQAATHTVMSFMPRDGIEAMLAGHCLMFHELIVDSVRLTLNGEPAAARRATRSGIVAMDKAFGNNLARLERYRNRQAEVPAEAHQVARTESEIADRVRRHQAATTAPRKQASGNGSAVRYPSPDAIAACTANAEAMAALDAGDPAAFARAMGVENPSAAYLAAASDQMAGFRREDIERRRQANP